MCRTTGSNQRAICPFDLRGTVGTLPRQEDLISMIQLRSGVLALILHFCMSPLYAGSDRPMPVNPPEEGALRVATFNIKELSLQMLANVNEEGHGRDPQVIAAARIIQRVRPDVLVILEIDHDMATPGAALDRTARLLAENYLTHGESPIEFKYFYAAPCNTGLLSGVDLNNDGVIAKPSDVNDRTFGGDCFGFGNYPGQYSMAVLSRVPLDTANARTFQNFLWKDLPGHHIADGLFGAKALAVARLSSKSHWDLPIDFGGKPLHLLVSHPTPQGFDGPEDRNGRRNFDEIMMWKFYLDSSDALVDDRGTKGGLAGDEDFVLLGDLNAAPGRGSKYDEQFAMDLLLNHPRVQDTGEITSAPGALRGRPSGAPDFIERNTIGSANGSRIDYVLPSKTLKVVGGGVYWPSAETELENCILAEYASDHRIVWVDIKR